MSGDIKYPAAQVRPFAEHVVAELAELCERIEIAGSLRREKLQVSDIEIVLLPKVAPFLLARLDHWIVTGRAHKAVYPDRSHRWGSKYRGLTFSGLPTKVEIFLADADNWGYQYWLRTGPADANHFVMQQVIAQHAPYRAVEGYWYADGQRLSVPHEPELFRLLGMDFVPPKDRTLEVYQQHMRGAWVTRWTEADVEAQPTQEGLF